MRRALLSAFLPLTFSIIAQEVSAQDRFAFAITDVAKDGMNWISLRKLDLGNGQYSDILLNGTDMKTAVFDASSRKPITLQADARYGNTISMPFSNGVAAAAYDRDHNRLYFTPMFVDQLRYIDMKTMKVYYVTGQEFTGKGNMHGDEGKIVTRMVIAPDGYGYAITNDGSELIRFSTDKKNVIENLGALVDDPANKMISIHNRCSSFGGDMICDDAGNLFILTAYNNVFKVNTDTKVATHLGRIQNLPANFTTNGAVVNADGQILVSSAVDGSGWFTVDPKSWAATSFTAANGVYKSSDLANSNYLSTKAKGANDFTLISRAEEKFSKMISIYPNPVTNNRVTLLFNKVPQGDYSIELTDVLGRSVQQKKISITSETQTEVLPLNESNSKGVYMVKMYDSEKLSVYTQKVVVQ
jgi:hypothetical protein